MPNTFFQFKQFRIDQESCAMKVCTDACIQGTYAAQWLKNQYKESAKMDILDIGTGTGLLALMLAQSLPSASITALEIDEHAFNQALENIKNSKWPERITVRHQDVRYWQDGARYDFIICNPPFFINDLKSSDLQKNRAKHAVSLNQPELLDAVKKHLSPQGAFCIMLPPKAFQSFRQISSAQSIYPVQILRVKQTTQSEVFRVIGIFRYDNTDAREELLSIHDDNRTYTAGFKEMLKDYYLNL